MFQKNQRLVDALEINPLMLLVLERLGFYPGYQDKKLNELANEKEMNVEVLIMLLNLHADKNYKPDFELVFDDVDIIIEYLKNSHRLYTDQLYPVLRRSVQDLKNSNPLPEMKMVERFFEDYLKEACLHFDYENQTVFPYIRSLQECIRSGKGYCKTEDYSVDVYKQHHDDIEEKLDDLKNLLIKHLPSGDDYPKRRRVIFDLFYLEHDLNVHTRIENEILVPLVERMEKKLGK